MSAERSLQDRVGAFAHELVVALLNLRMHAPHSDHVLDGVRRSVLELHELCASGGTDHLRLEAAGDRLQWNGTPLIGASLQAQRLLDLWSSRGVQAVRFGALLDEEELLEFLQLLSDEHAPDAFRPGTWERALGSRGVRNVRVEPARTETGDAGGDPERAEALRQYQAMADFLQSSHVQAYRGDELEIEGAAGVVERAVWHLDEEPSGLLALAMCDDIDNFTVGHSVRVTLLALQVADAAGASRSQLLRIGTAALLHDIGKSRIPQEILFKSGRLEPDERRMMAEHARLGGEILLEQHGVDPAAIGAAFCHHMGPAGNGYPTPVLPFEPSGLSRLVRVCDVFEALTSARPYKPAMPPLQAYVIMSRMKGAFDRRWLRFFIRSIGLFPVGTRVELDTGEEALVIAPGPALQQPQVRVMTVPAHEPRCAEKGTLLTVGEEHEGTARRIRAVVGAGVRMDVPLPGEHLGSHHDEGCACELVAELVTPSPGMA